MTKKNLFLRDLKYLKLFLILVGNERTVTFPDEEVRRVYIACKMLLKMNCWNHNFRDITLRIDERGI